MTDDTKEIKRALESECGKGFMVGKDFYSPSIRVGGRYFHFRPDQQRFLYTLTKTRGDIEQARRAARWPEGAPEKFFSTAKWREYKEKVLAVAAIRNGDIRDEWWSFMLDGMRGKIEYFSGKCDLCHQDYKLRPESAEQYRTDDMKLEMSCYICKTVVALEHIEEEFKPTREQVQCASEVGNRVEPKTERISHSFTEETFSFVTDGEVA